MTGEIKKNEMAANAEDEFQKEFKARLAKLPKNEPNQAFFQEFLQPKVDSLNEETYEWLNKNGYHDILTTQIRQMRLKEEDQNQHAELIEKEKKARQELESSKKEREDIKEKIRTYQVEGTKLDRLHKLLEEDMLDLNNIEQQMVQTLECEFIDREDLIGRILWEKRNEF